jgi:hypothetical protein
MADRLRTEPALDALSMATRQRSPEETTCHSDQDSSCIALAFGKR